MRHDARIYHGKRDPITWAEIFFCAAMVFYIPVRIAVEMALAIRDDARARRYRREDAEIYEIRARRWMTGQPK